MSSMIRTLGMLSLILLITACSNSKPATLYNVHGTISGQTGSVTIALNVNYQTVDTLDLTSEDNSFAFNNDTKINDIYRVVVTNAPANQDCNVTALGSGKVDGNINGVKIHCATWLSENNNVPYLLNNGPYISNAPIPASPEPDLIWDTTLARLRKTMPISALYIHIS